MNIVNTSKIVHSEKKKRKIEITNKISHKTIFFFDNIIFFYGILPLHAQVPLLPLQDPEPYHHSPDQNQKKIINSEEVGEDESVTYEKYCTCPASKFINSHQIKME